MNSGRGGGSRRDEEEENSSDSSSASAMGMLGVAAAGVAFLGWGISKLMSAPEEEKPRTAAPISVRSDNFYTYSTPRGSQYPYTNDESESDDDNPFQSPAGFPGSGSNSSTILVRWEKPPPGWYKLNFDGSDRHQKNLAGAGCIIRNHRGDPVIAATYSLKRENVSFAEAEALRKGLELAKSLNIRVLYIEGDSKEIIDRLKGFIPENYRSPSRMDVMIRDIKQELTRSLRSWEIKHVKEGANAVADALAFMGAKFDVPNQRRIWNEDLPGSLPSHVISLVEKDKV